MTVFGCLTHTNETRLFTVCIRAHISQEKFSVLLLRKPFCRLRLSVSSVAPYGLIDFLLRQSTRGRQVPGPCRLFSPGKPQGGLHIPLVNTLSGRRSRSWVRL